MCFPEADAWTWTLCPQRGGLLSCSALWGSKRHGCHCCTRGSKAEKTLSEHRANQMSPPQESACEANLETVLGLARPPCSLKMRDRSRGCCRTSTKHTCASFHGESGSVGVWNGPEAQGHCLGVSPRLSAGFPVPLAERQGLPDRAEL